MKLLIDSDACLDFLTGRMPHYIHAKRLFGEMEAGSWEGLVSPHSFSNMFYILNQEHPVEKVISKLKMLEKIITIATLSGPEINSALGSGWNDFEDAIQYYCARENGCETIITRNWKDFTHSRLPVLSPQEFLAQQKKSDQQE